MEVEKDRLRFLVRFMNTEFFIHIDKVTKPEFGYFLEVKSRTWSRQDAEEKTRLAVQLIQVLGENPKSTTSQDYIEMVDNPSTG